MGRVRRGGLFLRLCLANLVAALAVFLLLPLLLGRELLRRPRLLALSGIAAGAGVLLGAFLLLGDADPAPPTRTKQRSQPLRELPAAAAAPAPVPDPIELAAPGEDEGEEEELVDEDVTGTPYGGDPFELRVRRGGEPAAGLRVRGWLPGLEAGKPVAEGVTDESGRVRLGDPRRLTAAVDADGRQVAAKDGDVDLEELEQLRGTVLGPQDEGLAAEVTVLVGAVPLARGRADASGGFALEWIPVEGAVIVATAEGFLPERTPWVRGKPQLLRLRPGSSGALRGRVMDADGLPLTGAVVRLIRGERGPQLAATDGLGWFAFSLLEAGAVTLEVHRPGEETPALRAAARVLAGEAAEVQLRIESGAVLSVVVRGEDGPVQGCQVQVVDPGVTRFGNYSESLAQPQRQTDADGLARFERLPAGRYYVRAHPNGRGAPLLAEVSLAAGTSQRVILEQVLTRELRIRVVDGDGRPVQGVFMDVSMPGINWSRMPTARSGADGVGVFADLPAGLAEVHLGKGGLWRMVRTEADEATFVWSEAATLRLQGTVTGWEGEVLVACALADVVHMTPARVGGGGLFEATITPPEGDCRVFLLARDRRLAPIDLGTVGRDGLLGFRAAFAPGATLTGRLVDGSSGEGIPGRVRLGGALAGVLEAQTQWLGGTDHDEWITVNEWSRATGPDGLFELSGLPAGASSAMELQAVGALGRSEALSPLEPGELRDLGQLPLGAR